MFKAILFTTTKIKNPKEDWFETMEDYLTMKKRKYYDINVEKIMQGARHKFHMVNDSA